MAIHKSDSRRDHTLSATSDFARLLAWCALLWLLAFLLERVDLLLESRARQECTRRAYKTRAL